MGRNTFRRANPWFWLVWGITIFFLVCKVFGLGVIASWPWWLVFVPVWGTIALGIAICLVALISLLLYLLILAVIAILS